MAYVVWRYQDLKSVFTSRTEYVELSMGSHLRPEDAVGGREEIQKRIKVDVITLDQTVSEASPAWAFQLMQVYIFHHLQASWSWSSCTVYGKIFNSPFDVSSGWWHINTLTISHMRTMGPFKSFCLASYFQMEWIPFFSFFFSPEDMFFFIDCRERGRRIERQTPMQEKHKSIDSCTCPNQGSNPETRYVP